MTIFNEAEADNPEEKLVLTILRNRKFAKDHQQDWQNDAEEWYEYDSGEQWSTEDENFLREQLRPIITFNRVSPVVEAVVGTEVTNKQEIRYIPRTIDDTGVNEVYTATADYIRDQCDADHEESDAFKDMVITGYGWTETRIDFDEDPLGKICIDRISPLEMWYDPSAKKKNLADRRWHFREKWVHKDDVKALWPDKYKDIFDEMIDTRDHIREHNAELAKFYLEDQSDPTERHRDEIKIIQYQWWERDTVLRVFTQNGFQDFPDKKNIRERLERSNFQFQRIKKKVYKQAFVAGRTLLEVDDSPVDGFTFNVMTAKRNIIENTWFGIVKAMKSPQEWSNKFFSTILDIVMSNSKGGVFAETNAFDNQQKAEDQWANPRSMILLKEGGLAKIRERGIGQYPGGLERMMQFAVTSIPDVTGVNLELLGLAGREQAGVLELQRKRSGLTILATLFDALRLYRKSTGKTLLKFIQNFIPDGRLIRIVGEEGAQFVPFVKNKEISEFDVIVDESPTSPNNKELVFAIMTQMLPTLQAMGVPIPPDIIRYSPLPTSLQQKWIEMLNQPPSQEQQIQQQIALETQTGKMRETDSKTALNIAKAEKERATAGKTLTEDDIQKIQSVVNITGGL